MVTQINICIRQSMRKYQKCVSLIEITVNPIKYFNIHVNDRVSITDEKDHTRVMSPCVQVYVYVSVHYSLSVGSAILQIAPVVTHINVRARSDQGIGAT